MKIILLEKHNKVAGWLLFKHNKSLSKELCITDNSRKKFKFLIEI